MTDELRHEADNIDSEKAAEAVQLALMPKGTDYAEIYNELKNQTARGAAVLGEPTSSREFGRQLNIECSSGTLLLLEN